MINLLPPSAKQSIKFARLNVILIHYVIITLIAVAVILALMFYGYTSLNNSKSELEKAISADRVKVAELEQINVEARSLSSTVNTIKKLLDSEVKFSILIQEIGSVLPTGTVLTNLTLSQENEDDPITLSILATDADRAGVLQQNLVKSDLFIGADILSVNRGQATEEDNYLFTADLQAYFDPELSFSTLTKPTSGGSN